jgi:hypothetical protein
MHSLYLYVDSLESNEIGIACLQFGLHQDDACIMLFPHVCLATSANVVHVYKFP